MREVLQYCITPTYLPLNEYIHLIFAIAEKYARIRLTCDIVSNESSFLEMCPTLSETTSR
jgi:hypothetical protein